MVQKYPSPSHLLFCLPDHCLSSFKMFFHGNMVLISQSNSWDSLGPSIPLLTLVIHSTRYLIQSNHIASQ